MRKLIITIGILIFAIVGIGLASVTATAKSVDISEIEYQKNNQFEDVSMTMDLSFKNEQFYINNQKIADEIRVPVGTNLSVTFNNNTPYSTSVHFHGVNGLSKMDGVAGVTQDEILPGESYVYQFNLDKAGTYMYHSHFDSANEVNNKKLFGGLVVEDNPRTNSEMLIYNSSPIDTTQHHSAASTYTQMEVNNDTNLTYNISNDEDIFLNIANLASTPISLNFGEGVNYQIIELDGEAVTSEWQNVSLTLPTANRITVQIKNPQKSFQVKTTLSNKENAIVNVIYKNEKIGTEYIPKIGVDTSMMGGDGVIIEPSEVVYNLVKPVESLNIGEPDVKSDMILDMTNGMWTINNKAFPDTNSIDVKEGDNVEITLENTSPMSEIHPFHLHGHQFEVVEVNGQQVKNPLVMDTVQVMPGDQVKIRFKADNPGIWMFHCHDLTHAAKGMMTTLNYKGYTNNLDSIPEK